MLLGIKIWICVNKTFIFFSAFFCRFSDDIDTECSVDTSGRSWTCSSGQSNFFCTVDDSGNRILCADKQHCPYAEESEPILITVYVKTEHFLVENYSKQFFLSDIGATSVTLWRVYFSAHSTLVLFYLLIFPPIWSLFSTHFHLLLSPLTVKPDKVNISKVNTTVIEWTYPSSWSSPFSYFPLTFQIALFKRPCKRCDNPCTDSKATKVRGPKWLLWNYSIIKWKWSENLNKKSSYLCKMTGNPTSHKLTALCTITWQSKCSITWVMSFIFYFSDLDSRLCKHLSVSSQAQD